MKKVLFVMHNLGFGGAERSLVNLLHELPADRYQIDVLLFQKKGELISQLPEWVRVLDTPRELNGLYAPVRQAGDQLLTKVVGTVCSNILRRTKKPRVAFRWQHFYKKKLPMLPEKYDVAAAYGGSELMYYVMDRVEADRKLIWIHNDYRTGKYSAVDDYAYLAGADEIVSISHACVDVLKEVFPDLADKICYIENITSSKLLRKRADVGVPEEYSGCDCNLLSVGRLFPQKGFDMAVDAAAILKKSGLDFRWFIIGEGYLREKLEQQIRQADVEDRFILLGTRSNPYPYMKHCTALIQPSRYEGKSVVLDEAKILATPIVATAYPTVRDQISQGQEGHIVPMDAQGIAEGILRVVNDRAYMEAIRAYLAGHEYGNAEEVEKYTNILDRTSL